MARRLLVVTPGQETHVRHEAARIHIAGRRRGRLRGRSRRVRSSSLRCCVSALSVCSLESPPLYTVDFDPLAKGYVANLSHPGGNVTGIFRPPDRARRQTR